jgi:hypothetical protein
MLFSILAESQYPMEKLKIITLLILLCSLSMHANANENEPNLISNIEPQRHKYSIQNLSDVFLSGGIVKQPSIAEKHNFEPRTTVNVDMEKISYALDNKGMRDIKNCNIYLSDKKFNFVNGEIYQKLLDHIDSVSTEKDSSSVPSKDSCFELLQFIF